MTKKEINYIKNLAKLSINNDEDFNIFIRNFNVVIKKSMIKLDDDLNDLTLNLINENKTLKAYINKIENEKEIYLNKGEELLSKLYELSNKYDNLLDDYNKLKNN